MQDVKTKLALVVGICLIALVASMVTLPFRNADSAVQKISGGNIQKLEDSEKKLFRFMIHEKAEMESKMDGKNQLYTRPAVLGND
ncbi:MAG TPA: hypothetical protein VLF17_02570 [Candidatus Nitrosotenuis sp.]|nr:hypothetical protein [Candidatus Nitrosotenuis sp.]